MPGCPPSHTGKASNLLQVSEEHTPPEPQHFFEQKPQCASILPITLFWPLLFLQLYSQMFHAPASELLNLPVAPLPSSVTKFKVAMGFPIPPHNFTISRPF